MCIVKLLFDYRYCDIYIIEYIEYVEIDLDFLKIKDNEDSDVLFNNSSFDN